MNWITLSVRAEASYAEHLSEALLERGALSVDMLDADADTPDEQAIFGEPGQPTSAVWQHNLVNALFPQDADVEHVLTVCCEALGILPLPPHTIEMLPDNDWVRLTQSQFDPIRISDRLWIVPTWHTPTDPAAINIVLDPGLAFGTGSHPTTRLCLRWLDANIRGGESLLDYGCGSGILAIAASKLGAGETFGVDIDAQAVQASRDNAQANHVEAQFFLSDNAPERQSDIVVANILTNPLRALAPLLAKAVKPSGFIVLSGILAEQADDIKAIYSEWFDFQSPQQEDGWVCLSGVKKNEIATARCPECETCFRVTPQQLNSHNGLVRCGNCRAVFNAKPPVNNMFAATDSPALPEPVCDPPSFLPQSPELSPLSPAIDTTLLEPAHTPEHHVAITGEFPEPTDARPVSRSRGSGIVGSLLFFILLLVQAAYFWRVEIVTQLPGLKPAFASACQSFGCSLPLPRKIDLVAIESSEMRQNPIHPAVTELLFTLQNRAGFAQAFPAVELTLLNTDEKMIARRVIASAEYLQQKVDEKIGLPPAREIQIQLNLNTMDLKPSGYKLFLFYPPGS